MKTETQDWLLLQSNLEEPRDVTRSTVGPLVWERGVALTLMGHRDFTAEQGETQAQKKAGALVPGLGKIWGS